MRAIPDVEFELGAQEMQSIRSRSFLPTANKRGSHLTITHDALDLTIQGTPGPGSPDMGPPVQRPPPSPRPSHFPTWNLTVNEPCSLYPRHMTSLYRNPPPTTPNHLHTYVSLRLRVQNGVSCLISALCVN